jgi:hypothetical protein
MNSILPTVTVTDFLTRSEIKYLVGLIMSDPCVQEVFARDTNTQCVSRRYYPNSTNHKIIANYLVARLESHDIFPTIDSIWILEAFIPFPIHNDVLHVIPESGQSRYYTLILPIEEVEAKTFICQETADSEYIDDYMKVSQPIEESQRFTQDFWEKNLSHCPINQRQYVSHEFTFDWALGSLLAFDRRRFHVSNNFLTNGITSKKALVSFTNVCNKNLNNMETPGDTGTDNYEIQ